MFTSRHPSTNLGSGFSLDRADEFHTNALLDEPVSEGEDKRGSLVRRLLVALKLALKQLPANTQGTHWGHLKVKNLMRLAQDQPLYEHVMWTCDFYNPNTINLNLH